jgi:hypothetical protein
MGAGDDGEVDGIGPKRGRAGDLFIGDFRESPM